MHHKRKRPKNRRAGCLMCKPFKANHAPLRDRVRPGIWRVMQGWDPRSRRSDWDE